MTKRASTDHPVHEFIAARWSPYGFDERTVDDADLLALFEAARWAASSYNEQPWSFLVATKQEPAEIELMLSCLTEPNQAWAKTAPVLAMCVATLNLRRNNQPNRVALHDLGLAIANLSFEATARGLSVHQMAGILSERTHEVYGIPEGSEAITGLAIGYPGDASSLHETHRERDLAPRQRKPLREFVYAGKWGSTAPLVP